MLRQPKPFSCLDTLRAFAQAALSVEVAAACAFIGAAASISWPLFYLAFKLQRESANPLILAPGARLFHIAGAVGLLIAAFLFNALGLEEARSMRVRASKEEEDSDAGSDADESEDEETFDDDDEDTRELLRVFTLRSLFGRGHTSRPVTASASLSAAIMLATAGAFYAQHGPASMVIWPSTEYVLVQGVSDAILAIFEEVGIRGFVLRRLRRVMPLIPANGLSAFAWLLWKLPTFLYLPGMMCNTEAECASLIGFHLLSLVGQSLLIGIVADHSDFALLPSMTFRVVYSLLFVVFGNTPSRAAFDLLHAEVCVGVYVFLSSLWRPVAINSALKQD